MIPAAFEYLAPTSLEEALALLATHGDEAKILAGGQSLFPLMKLRLATPRYLVDLNRIPGLVGIAPVFPQGAAASSAISIGAMTPYYQVEESDLLRRVCPLLGQTAAVVADVQVRNQGTVGGSLAHADPTGDMPAAALALGAQVKAVGRNGQRWLEIENFFTGFFGTELAADEIITEIRVPMLTGWSSAYLKAASRSAGFAVAGVAVCLRQNPDGRCEDVRIGVTGITDKPYRASAVEDRLRGQSLRDETIDEAAAIVADGFWIADDVRASAAYRAHLARLYTARALKTARDVAPA